MYDIATAPVWISLYEENLIYQCATRQPTHCVKELRAVYSTYVGTED